MRNWERIVDNAPARRRVSLRVFHGLIAAASLLLVAALILQLLGRDGRYEWQNPFFDAAFLLAVSSLVVGYCPRLWKSAARAR